MKILIFIFIFTVSLFGCSSIRQSTFATPRFFKVEALALNSSEAEAKKVLGEPYSISPDEHGTIWRYAILHKGFNIPVIALTFNTNGKLIEKHMTLDPSYSVDVSGFQKRYKNISFKNKVETYATSNHSYSSRGYLSNETSGIYAEYNTARNDEIQTVRWVLPESSAAK